MKISFFLLFTLLALPAVAQNTTTQTPLPPGKLPEKAPDYCRWVVSYQYQKFATPPSAVRSPIGKAEPGDNRPAKVVVIKTGKITSQTIDYVSGQRTESWIVNQAHLQRSSSHPGISAATVQERSPDFVSVQDGDFPEFEWIHLANFKGVQQWQGREVLLFQKEDIKHTGSSSSCSALIDSKSHLPILLQTGETLRLYEFSLLPKTEQALPPDVASYLDKLNDSFRRLLATPARPF